MSFDLWENDFIGDIPLAHLTDVMDYQDLRESQDRLISVQYNEIDIGRTNYGFNQEFRGVEANQYFERMKTFSGMTINEIIDRGFHAWHFYRTSIKGTIKKVFDSIDPIRRRIQRNLG